MPEPTQKTYFFISLIAHAILLLIFIIGFEFTSTLPVFENTNKHDIISAVVLGDTEKSKILPQKLPTPPPAPTPKLPEPKKVEPPLPEPPKPVATPKPQPIKKDAIALKAAKPKPKIDFAKDLLADIKKTSVKQKQVKQKQLQSHFQKTLREQAEKTLRQQLLNEEIKLQGTQSRQSQGIVNKYKALIVQAISEHWVIPTQANKNRYCELMIRLAPGGLVLDVQVTKSSGDPSLDSSARAAVLKASPLPVPSDHNEFEPFKQFVLRVKPENILASSGV